MDLVKETNEYDLTQPKAGFFHCISKNPDYHVEMAVTDDGAVTAKCHCAVFKKSKVCKHQIAALMILRDHRIRNRRVRSKSKHEKILLDEVLKKLSVTELRKFISAFAHSHSAFRAEVLAHYLHLIRKPDYHHLLTDMTPMDKYGVIKLNRNNLKSVRNIVSILLKKAQELLKDNALPQVIQILEAVIHHLYRLYIKVPQFQDQLATELRHALKLFEAFCRLPMAPRLQKIAITLAMEVSGREGFTIIKGVPTLLQSAEPFILEKKARKSAFQLVEDKIKSDHPQRIKWACLLLRWTRLWEISSKQKAVKSIFKTSIPDLLTELQVQRAYDDILFALNTVKADQFPPTTALAMRQIGFRAAKLVGDDLKGQKLAYELSTLHHDQEAWDALYLLDPVNAIKSLKVVDEYFSPDENSDADSFLLHGYQESGQKDLLLKRLTSLGDINQLMQYDRLLIHSHPLELVELYARHMKALREKYGGETVRRKLTNIIYHLKEIDLHTMVVEHLKKMDKKENQLTEEESAIKGFIFDLDGVIVDTAEHHFDSWKTVFKELGADISKEDDRHTRGASRMESLAYLASRYNIQLTQEEKEFWAAKKNDIYLKSIEEITPRDLLPGVLAFLIDAKKAGLSIALGSASKNAKSVIDKLGVKNRFDVILDGTSTKISKPDPEIFIKCCEAMNLDPSDVIVFEDAAKGVKAALAAGCKVVGIGDPDILHEANLTMSGLDQSTPQKIIEQLS